MRALPTAAAWAARLQDVALGDDFVMVRVVAHAAAGAALCESAPTKRKARGPSRRCCFGGPASRRCFWATAAVNEPLGFMLDTEAMRIDIPEGRRLKLDRFWPMSKFMSTEFGP